MERIYAFKETTSKIKPSDKIYIYHDMDADGITSAVLLEKYLLEHINITPEYIKNQYHKPGPRRISQEIFEEIKNFSANYVFIADLSVDEDFKGLEILKNQEHIKKIIIVDHHKLINDYEGDEKILVIKPQLISDIEPSRYPTSKLMYDLINTAYDKIENYWWLAAIGIIGDAAYTQWEEFIKQKAPSEKYIQELFYAQELMDYAIAYNEENAGELVEIIRYAKSPSEIIEKLKKYEIIKQEIEKVLEEHKSKAQFLEDVKLIVYKVESPHSIKSQISNKLSEMYRDYTIVVYGKSNTDNRYLTASFRNAAFKVDVANLIQKISKKVPGVEGGGHKPAAGARIPVEKEKEFLNALFEEIKNL